MASETTQVVKLPLEEPPRERGLRLALLVGLMVLGCAPIAFLVVQDQYAKAAAIKAFWRVEGTPCAPLAAEVFRGNAGRASVTPYDGAVYARRGGGMTCTHRTEEIDGAPVRYPVCKFNAPDYLAVRVGDQERFYDLTMGRAAAVDVIKGQVRCVVAPGFEM